ncbi:MAG: cytochrome o ubiquinol oxidase subunit III [Syntrophobacteraceae bacterium]|nr:cytochrome o ubiquinol oxidase subunit III [Syntrophobacteraceae bacterium]
MTNSASTLDHASAEKPGEQMLTNQMFGFWIYLMSDLVLFSAIFGTFAVLCHNYAGGPTGRELFHLPYVLLETMLLLSSSATCGLAMTAMRDGKKTLVIVGLALTFALGLGFLSLELSEFHRMVLEGAGPGRSAFLSAFFTLVGTHGLHVGFGLLWMAVAIVQVGSKGLSAPVQSRLMRLSMFWHFLDIVWIGVFTTVYLLGVL